MNTTQPTAAAAVAAKGAADERCIETCSAITAVCAAGVAELAAMRAEVTANVAKDRNLVEQSAARIAELAAVLAGDDLANENDFAIIAEDKSVMGNTFAVHAEDDADMAVVECGIKCIKSGDCGFNLFRCTITSQFFEYDFQSHHLRFFIIIIQS